MNSAKRVFIPVIFLVSIMLQNSVRAQSSDILGVVSKEEVIANDRIYGIYIKRYQPDAEAVQYLSTYKDSVKIIVFLGSWCRESKKYIPGLMKTLEVFESDFIATEYIGVDQQKKFPKSFLKKFDIKYIPTVVVLKGNTELGRIVEKPHQLIETDLVQILESGNLKKE